MNNLLPRVTAEQKRLIVLVIALVVLLFVFDLVAGVVKPSLLAGLHARLPKKISANLLAIELGAVAFAVVYVVGSFVLHRITLVRQRQRMRETGKQGRTYEVVVPRDIKPAPGAMAQVLGSIWDATAVGESQVRAGAVIPVSLEYVYREGKIHCQVWTPKVEGVDVAHVVKTAVLAMYPDSRVLPKEADLLEPLTGDAGQMPLSVGYCREFGVSGPAHYPLKLLEEFGVDPLSKLLTSLSTRQTGVEIVAIQVVAAALPNTEWEPARAAMSRTLSGADAARGGGLGFSLKELIIPPQRGRQAPVKRVAPADRKKQQLLDERIAGQPGFRVVIRILAAGSDGGACKKRVQQVATELRQFNGASIGPQSLVQTREFEFAPGREQPAEELSASQMATLEKLRQRMAAPAVAADGNGHAPSSATEAAPQATAAVPEPAASVQPILYRMLTPRSPYWPPWGSTTPHILLGESLATLYHLPHRDLAVPGLVTRIARHIPPPQEPLISPAGEKPPGWLVMARADHDEDPAWYVGMPYDDLPRGGIYVLGPAGTGKSVALRYMGVQFIQERRGLSVIDPKVDLVLALLRDIPLELEDRVCYLSPSALWRPAVINVMDGRLVRAVGVEQVQTGVLATFQKTLGGNWDQYVNIKRILENAVTALCEGKPDPSIVDLYTFCQDDTEDSPNLFRQAILENVRDAVARTFWLKEYPEMGKQYAQSAVSVRTRVEAFLRNRMTRYLTGLPHSTINFRQVMDNGLYFFTAVPDTLGAVQKFVGALYIAQFYAAGFSRYTDIPVEAERPLHILIVDEFHTFAAEKSEDLENVLAKLRGARVVMVLAHQSTAQIAPATMKIILANNKTRLIFSLSDNLDASNVLGSWEAQLTRLDLMGMQPRNHEAMMSCMVQSAAIGPFSVRTLMAPPPVAEPLGPLPPEEFVWPVRDEYDEWLAVMAGLELEMIRSARQRDREREQWYLEQQVALLREMSEAERKTGIPHRERYVARRRERDRAELDYIRRYPASIADKFERIERMSGLQFGVPCAEAEEVVRRVVEQAIGEPVPVEDGLGTSSGLAGQTVSIADVFKL